MAGMKYRNLRTLLLTVFGALYVSPVALVVAALFGSLLSCSSKSPEVGPEMDIITFDPDVKGTLADLLPTLEHVAAITITNRLKDVTRELPEENWQQVYSLFEDTRPAMLHQVLVYFGEVRINTRADRVVSISIYGSTELIIYELFDGDGKRLGYFVPVNHNRDVLPLLPEWEE
jgi:hypothetical protein